METTLQITSRISDYITGLDWQYILTFIILTIGINGYYLNKESSTRKRTRTRYRVALIGILYGITIYCTRSYSLHQAELLFQSFIFTLVFHKLIIDSVLIWLAKHGMPEHISKLFLGKRKFNN